MQPRSARREPQAPERCTRCREMPAYGPRRPRHGQSRPARARTAPRGNRRQTKADRVRSHRAGWAPHAAGWTLIGVLACAEPRPQRAVAGPQCATGRSGADPGPDARPRRRAAAWARPRRLTLTLDGKGKTGRGRGAGAARRVTSCTPCPASRARARQRRAAAACWLIATAQRTAAAHALSRKRGCRRRRAAPWSAGTPRTPSQKHGCGTSRRARASATSRALPHPAVEACVAGRAAAAPADVLHRLGRRRHLVGARKRGCSDGARKRGIPRVLSYA